MPFPFSLVNNRGSFGIQDNHRIYGHIGVQMQVIGKGCVLESFSINDDLMTPFFHFENARYS